MASEHEYPSDTMSGLKIAAVQVVGDLSVDGNDRRTKSGRFTLAQLRATDGICPLQSGTNQFDSQKGKTGFGTPRNTQTKIEFDDEDGKQWPILMTTNRNRVSVSNMTGFGTPRDVKGKHLKRIWELEFPEEAEKVQQPLRISARQASPQQYYQQPQYQQSPPQQSPNYQQLQQQPQQQQYQQQLQPQQYQQQPQYQQQLSPQQQISPQPQQLSPQQISPQQQIPPQQYQQNYQQQYQQQPPPPQQQYYQQQGNFQQNGPPPPVAPKQGMNGKARNQPAGGVKVMSPPSFR